MSKLTEREKILIKRTYKKCSYYCQIIFRKWAFLLIFLACFINIKIFKSPDNPVIYISVFGYFLVFILIIIQIFQIVDYKIASSNRTNYYFNQIIVTEYFIDREKYSYLICIHLSITILIISWMEISIDVLHAIILTHIIGIFDKIG